MDKWGQLVCTKVFILALCCHPKKAPINMPYPHTLSTCPIHTRYQYKLSTHRINTPFPVSFALHSLLSHLSCTLSTHPINAPYQRTHPISTHILSINTHILSTLTPYQHPPPPLTHSLTFPSTLTHPLSPTLPLPPTPLPQTLREDHSSIADITLVVIAPPPSRLPSWCSSRTFLI